MYVCVEAQSIFIIRSEASNINKQIISKKKIIKGHFLADYPGGTTNFTKVKSVRRNDD